MNEFWKNKSERWLRVFDGLIKHRVQAYRTTFNWDDPQDRITMKDLARFCRASDNTYGATNEHTHVLIGRREVWLRIQQHLNLSPEALTEIALGPTQE